jgi:hypothetical protein
MVILPSDFGGRRRNLKQIKLKRKTNRTRRKNMAEEIKSITKDEKLALATKIVGHLELARARATDGYDVLMIVGQLLFPGRVVTLTVREFMSLEAHS